MKTLYPKMPTLVKMDTEISIVFMGYLFSHQDPHKSRWKRDVNANNHMIDIKCQSLPEKGHPERIFGGSYIHLTPVLQFNYSGLYSQTIWYCAPSAHMKIATLWGVLTSSFLRFLISIDKLSCVHMILFLNLIGNAWSRCQKSTTFHANINKLCFLPLVFEGESLVTSDFMSTYL